MKAGSATLLWTLTSCFEHDGLCFLGEVVKRYGRFSHHVHASEDEASDRSESDCQGGQSCYASGNEKIVVHQHASEHCDQCLGGEASNCGVPETKSFAEDLGTLLEQLCLVLQSLVELRIFARSGHHAGDGTDAIRHSGDAVAESEHKYR